MKKKTLANLLMVVLILAIAAGGCLLAFRLRTGEETDLGSQFQSKAIANDLLVEEGQQEQCHITILCDTILDNLSQLEEGKSPYVPTDGVILNRTTVSFAEGDTVFQVLQKVCAAADIQIEYSWTPLYDSYYVEGINHLYEFDCGMESGWMYKVNDWFPNYGCSSYELKDGDTVVWCYTCVGLGADVGEVRMDES